MGRKTLHRRKAQSYNYLRNKRTRQKKKMKTQVKIADPVLNEAWMDKKSIKANLKAVGLASNPNSVVSQPSSGIFRKNEESAEPQTQPTNPEVLTEYEKLAAIPEQYRVKFTENLTRFVIYMMNKYGGDYEAAARDRRNYDQHSATQIRKKVENFKKQTSLYTIYQSMKEQGWYN